MLARESLQLIQTLFYLVRIWDSVSAHKAVLIVLAIGWSWPLCLMGAEQFNLFESVRFFGRGRTFVAGYDTNEASRFNPATLAESDISFQLRPGELDFFAGTEGIGKVSDLVNSLSNKDKNETSILADARDWFGTNINGRGQLSLFSMRFGAFEVSPFSLAAGYSNFRNPSLPSIDWKINSVAGINLSYGFHLWPNLALGVTIRPLYHWYLAGNIGVVDAMDFENLDGVARVVSGFGVGVDMGAIYKLTDSFRIALLTQNFGDIGYFQDYGTEPPPIKQKLSTGILWRVPISEFDFDLLVDYQGLINRGGITIMRLVHIGGELGYSLFSRDHDFGLTMGLNEGYFGGGVFFDLFIARIEYTNYAVELGEYPGQRPDRRQAFALKSSITF